MLLFENIALALTSLKANKMRALLTMLGIIIGISSVIAIMTVGNSLQSTINSSMQSMGASDVTVYLKNRSEEEGETGASGMTYESVTKRREVMESDLITTDMIEQFRQIYPEMIDGIYLQEVLGSGWATRGKDYANISVYGVNADYFISSQVTLLAGRQMSESDYANGRNVALVTDKLVENMFAGDNNAAIGEEIEVQIGQSYYRYTIVGVYKYEQNAMMGYTMEGRDMVTDMYIPVLTAQTANHSSGGYQMIGLVTAGGTNSDDLVLTAKNFFNSFYRTNRYYDIGAFSMSSMVSSMMGVMDTVTIAIEVIAGISLLVGGVGVMNIMLVSITERTREIGTRKALGAPNSSIRLQFIMESMVICLIGGLIGVLLGIGLGMFAAGLLGAPAEPTMSSIVISLVFSMSIGVFFGYYPANKAAKMDPIEALRYE